MSRRFIGLFGLVAAVTLAGCSSTNWEEMAEERQRMLLDKDAQIDAMTQDTAKALASEQAAIAAKAQAERDAAAARQQASESARVAREWQAAADAAKRDAEKSAPVAAAPVPSGVDESRIQQTAAELGKEFPGQVSVTPEGNVEITLSSDVTFAKGKTALTDSGKKSLRGLSNLLNGKFAPYMIRVEGHTDAEPLNRTKSLYTDNFGLGSARALEVVRFMKSDLNVDAKRLMSASRGEQDPKAEGKSETAYAKNRRVEIVVVIPRDAAIAQAK